MRLYSRPSEPDDARDLAPRLREADKAEVKAVGISSPLIALSRGFHHSEVARTVCQLHDDEIVAMYGVVRMEDTVPTGAAWCLGSDGIARNGLEFAIRSEEHLNELQETYPLLFNYVDARNELHIRWLQWSGFQFINRHDNYGHEQRPFYEFIRAR